MARYKTHYEALYFAEILL